MTRKWRAAALGVLAAAGGFFGYAIGVEPYAVELVEFDLLCPRLPKSFDGLTILQLSDFHMRRLGRREKMVANMASQMHPDIVALTGDLVHTPAGIAPFMKLAQSFKARIGVYAIFGNSEHKNGIVPKRLIETLAQSGIQTFMNDGIRLERGEDSIYLCGVDDPSTYHDDVAIALDGARPGEFKLLLMHSPDNISEAAFQEVDLVLSGHTHGGQVRFPFFGAVFTRSILGFRMNSGYFAGRRLRRLIGRSPGATQLYVNRGVGVSGLALRFLCPPEITLITLRSL